MNELHDNSDFAYQIDRSDCVASVETAWLDFNGKPTIRPPTVRVWDFISGYEVRHLFKLMFDTARSEHREVTVPFRCDTPAARRFMELRIKPLEEGRL